MKKIKYIVLGCFTLIFSACGEDFLTLPPQEDLDNVNSLNTYEKLLVATRGMYVDLRQLEYYGRGMTAFPEIAADAIKLNPSNSNRYVFNYNYSLSPINTQTALWNDAYETISLANLILAAIENGVSGGTADELNHLKGEALFVRALGHFDLVRIFAQPYAFTADASHLGIPIMLKSEIGQPARNTVAEVYTQVIQDLEAAQDLMANTGAPYQASKSAVNALLSRVYLTRAKDNTDLQNAADRANEVMSAGFNLVPTANYVNSWKSEGTSESILELRFLPFESRGSDGLGAIYTEEGYGDLLPTQDIIGLYDNVNDIRRGFFRTIGGTVYTYKYPGRNQVGLDNPRLIRLAEVILNKAEAHARLGQDADARTEVNKIKSRANITTLDGATTGAALITEIKQERRRELAFEGHRWFDIKRYGEALVVNDCIRTNPNACNLAAGNFLFAYPIPRREINANPNIQQNEGYQ